MSTPQDNLIQGLKAMLKWGNGPCGGGGTVDDHSNGRREAEYRMKAELRRLLKEFESAASSELADAACSAEGALAEAMQDVWNDHGEDCGEVPRCFDVKGPRTTRIYADFEGSAFVHGVVTLLAARGYTIQPNAPESSRTEPKIP
jgi:hypothetical protein